VITRASMHRTAPCSSASSGFKPRHPSAVAGDHDLALDRNTQPLELEIILRKGPSRRADTDRSTILLTPLVMRLLASAHADPSPVRTNEKGPAITDPSSEPQRRNAGWLGYAPPKRPPGQGMPAHLFLAQSIR
jgi:hypothetical protein